MVLPWTLYSISSWSVVVAPVAETILIAMKLLPGRLGRRHTHILTNKHRIVFEVELIDKCHLN